MAELKLHRLLAERRARDARIGALIFAFAQRAPKTEEEYAQFLYGLEVSCTSYQTNCAHCAYLYDRMYAIECENEDLKKKLEAKEPEKVRKPLICPDCGAETDGDVHQVPGTNGERCDWVMGRRGWRKLGDYDG